jgi:Ras-related protein Rab-11B
MRIVEYYKVYNPEKLRDVEALLAYYNGREYDLWSAMDQKYGTNMAASVPQQPAYGGRPPQQHQQHQQQAYHQPPPPRSAAPAVRKKPHKVILLGNSGVGKTNLLSRLHSGEFSDDFASTVGVEFLTHVMEISDAHLNSTRVKAQIWDTAGQERFNSMMSTYYRNAKGALIVYDIGRPETLQAAQNWLHKVREVGDPELAVILVGNKCDLHGGERMIPRADGVAFAAKNRMLFEEASAKTGQNVEKAFRDVITLIHKRDMEKNAMEAVHNSGNSPYGRPTPGNNINLGDHGDPRYNHYQDSQADCCA